MKRRTSAGSGKDDRGSGRAWPVWLATGMACVGLAACGGGGAGNGLESLGAVQVTVRDTFGAPVANATVEGPRGSSTTNGQGVGVVVVDSPDGTATVTISGEALVDQSIVTTSTAGQVNEVTVTVDRATSPAGGSLASRSGVVPVVSDNAQQLSFETDLVVVDGDSRPIENLSSASFVLRACTPDPADERADCVQGADADVAYTPETSAPAALELIAGGAATPYAAALLLDQSGSIAQHDATSARLFSAKAFLGTLGEQDQALLAAFAGAPGASIPTTPLTVYGPFREQASGSSYFPTLDALATQVGGHTPLYASLDSLRQQVAGDASLPAGLARAVVLFTDGGDTTCGSAQACRTRRLESIRGATDSGVRLFTIGLSSGVDVLALSELANQTGGAFLYADTPEQLLPLYGSVGKLLSLSLPTYRLRWTVRAASPGAFRPGDTLLGRVQVTAGTSSFDVPFVVGIP